MNFFDWSMVKLPSERGMIFILRITVFLVITGRFVHFVVPSCTL
jgi:hypothetical protein